MDKRLQPPDQDLMARERLLSAALELFTSRGYASASVREIAAAAGVNKPALYYYFGSKEGIYLELMQSAYVLFTERTGPLVAFQGTARERVIHFCTGFLDEFLAHIAVGRLIYSICFGPPQGAPQFPHEQFFDEMLEIIRAMVRDGITTGEVRNVDEGDAAWALISVLNSVMEEQLCRTSPRVDREGLVRMLALIFDGLGREK
jgi:TetR/AcrR family transcriptional regulator